MRDIQFLIVHHTATPSWISVESIRRYHVGVRGWSDIGYHYLIQRDGVIRLGRPEERSGAHCKGRNLHSIGVAVIGNFEETALGIETEEQLQALEYLLRDLKYRYPKSTVEGHCRFANTLCPGQHLLEWIGDR